MDIEDISDEEENYYSLMFLICGIEKFVILQLIMVLTWYCSSSSCDQGFEVYNEKLIAHSLGNFVFDLSYPETFPSLILNSSLDIKDL